MSYQSRPFTDKHGANQRMIPFYVLPYTDFSQFTCLKNKVEEVHSAGDGHCGLVEEGLDVLWNSTMQSSQLERIMAACGTQHRGIAGIEVIFKH